MIPNITKTAKKIRKKPKPYKIKGTLKQKRAVQNLADSGSLKEAMIKADYSPNTAIAPTKLTRSKGFLQLCEEMGLTNDLLVNSLVDDIRGKPLSRHKELELGFKVKGLLRETPQEEKSNISNISYDRARSILIREVHIRE